MTPLEQRLLKELLQLHAAQQTDGAGQAPSAHPSRFRQPLRRTHLVQNVMVWGALLAVGVVLAIRVANVDGGSALAATPTPLRYVAPGPGSPTAHRLLLRLARKASQQPPVEPAQGPYAYVKTVGWYLAAGSGPGANNVFPQTTQSWSRPNGSGRVVTVTGSGNSRRVSVGHPASGPRVLQLATTPGGVARQLRVGHPTADGPQEQLVAFTDTASRQPIGPASEAAILRVLARIPHLVNRGTVIDRAGRRAIAVSLDSSRYGDRYTLILDPRTGQLLGSEQTLIGSPHKLHVRRGAVLAYTTIIRSGYVQTTSAFP